MEIVGVTKRVSSKKSLFVQHFLKWSKEYSMFKYTPIWGIITL